MERIREVRLDKGLSYMHLSDLSGVPASSVEHLEKKSPAFIERVEAIASALGVSPAWLCGWSDQKSDGRVRIVEKIVEVPVVVTVYKDMERIPNCWQSEENQIIQWTRRGKPVR